MVNSQTPAEVTIDEALVRALLRAQCPDIHGVATDSLSLAPFSNGWDNDIWSFGYPAAGQSWLVRLPRRSAAAALIENEQKWLPLLATRLSLPVPVPVFAGAPGQGFPWCWSVVQWFPGEVAARSMLSDQQAEAARLAGFLRALHAAAPAEAPVNQFRGLPVADIAPKYGARRDRLYARLDGEDRDVAALDRVMELGLGAPVHAGSPVMLHGDMHSGNVLVDHGALSAVVDWGDVCAGDPACDLQIAWMLFDAPARDVFFGTYGEGQAGLWERARAWAVHSALMYLESDDGDALLTTMGNAILDRVLRH